MPKTPQVPAGANSKYRSSPAKRLSSEAARKTRSTGRPGGENFWAVFGDGDGVLEVRREALVGGDHRPTVGQETGPPVAHVDHRLDRHDQAGSDQRAPPGFAVV